MNSTRSIQFIYISELKGTVSDKKILQITLEIKKNTFQHVPFLSKQIV